MALLPAYPSEHQSGMFGAFQIISCLYVGVSSKHVYANDTLFNSSESDLLYLGTGPYQINNAL